MASIISGCEIWKMPGQANNILVELLNQQKESVNIVQNRDQ